MSPYYEQDGITIYHGDCREVLQTLGRFDLLLTDPPYGIGAVKRGTIGTSKKGVVTDYGAADWDNSPPDVALIEAVRAKASNSIIFGGNFFHLPPSSCWLVWDKDNTGDFADCELAWTDLKKAVRKLTYRWNGMLQEPGCPKERRVHPTQKPEAVMRWALMQAPAAVTVLDPFMGSGTTLVACKRLGRRAVGIEREQRYCDLAIERLSQGALFSEATA